MSKMFNIYNLNFRRSEKESKYMSELNVMLRVSAGPFIKSPSWVLISTPPPPPPSTFAYDQPCGATKYLIYLT